MTNPIYLCLEKQITNHTDQLPRQEFVPNFQMLYNYIIQVLLFLNFATFEVP